MIQHAKPDFSKLTSGIDLSNVSLNDLKLDSKNIIHEKIENEDIIVLKNSLTDLYCDSLIQIFEQANFKSPVSIQGRKDIIDDRVGSMRTSGWSEKISNQIWEQIKDYTEIINTTNNDFYPSDWHQGNVSRVWRPIGISPLLRYMRYENGGQHYCHYDASYIYEDNRIRTLKSIVIYLSTHEESGFTRFIEDGQSQIPVYDRNHEDWIREVKENEVTVSIKPIKGNILLFPHRLAHDVQPYYGIEPRIIIRGDIIYEAI